jgi:hypothetical protein
MRFNINNDVKVKLTDFGRKTHRANHDMAFMGWQRPPKYVPPTEDADGWSRWQMWNLMNEFGRVMVNGFKVPFETEIDIIEPTIQQTAPEKSNG